MKDLERVGTTRRIVVSDRAEESRPLVQGRKLENPPDSPSIRAQNTKPSKPSRPRVRKPVLIIGLSAALVFVAVIAVLALKQTSTQPRATATPIESSSHPVDQSSIGSREPDELRRIEEDAKQVLRSISRDDKPYSFTDNAVKDIHSRVVELSRSTQVANSLTDLQANAASLGSQASKAGLQPGLAMLVGMAVANVKGSASSAATRALPVLTSLNKSFGSNEAESCLILIAAFHEGPGTQRSHPLLRRMNRVITNPLTQRNVWYLNEQNVISAEAYALVVDTIACGIIARNPRQFGIQTDPLRL